MKRIATLLWLYVLSSATGAAAIDSPEPLEISEAQVLERTDVRFPATMRALGIREGNVSLVLSLDEDGQLIDSFVLECTRQAFAKSALKSIEQWTFAPAICDEEPIRSAIRIDLSFQVDRKLAWQTLQAPVETNVTKSALNDRPITAFAFGELDAIPLPVEMPEPHDTAEGRATIEFYIDELGNVRCPKITAGTSKELGKSMLEAVSHWRFQPPLAAGSRTNTMVRQTFTFKDGALTASRLR